MKSSCRIPVISHTFGGVATIIAAHQPAPFAAREKRVRIIANFAARQPLLFLLRLLLHCCRRGLVSFHRDGPRSCLECHPFGCFVCQTGGGECRPCPRPAQPPIRLCPHLRPRPHSSSHCRRSRPWPVPFPTLGPCCYLHCTRCQVADLHQQLPHEPTHLPNAALQQLARRKPTRIGEGAGGRAVLMCAGGGARPSIAGHDGCNRQATLPVSRALPISIFGRAWSCSGGGSGRGTPSSLQCSGRPWSSG